MCIVNHYIGIYSAILLPGGMTEALVPAVLWIRVLIRVKKISKHLFA